MLHRCRSFLSPDHNNSTTKVGGEGLLAGHYNNHAATLGPGPEMGSPVTSTAKWENAFLTPVRPAKACFRTPATFGILTTHILATPQSWLNPLANHVSDELQCPRAVPLVHQAANERHEGVFFDHHAPDLVVSGRYTSSDRGKRGQQQR